MPAFSKRVAVRNELLLALFICLIVSGCISRGFGASWGHVDAFVVSSSDSISAGCDGVSYREVALACHRVSPGDNTVIGIRKYSDRGLDQERFNKITIVFSGDISPNESFSVENGAVRIFYSTGPSFRLGGSGCYGRASTGEVTVRTIAGGAVAVEGHAIFDLKSPLDWPGHCKRRQEDFAFLAERRALADLGPWHGVPGESASLVDETHPGSTD